MDFLSRDGLETDFAVADRRQVHLLVEAKEGETAISKSLLALKIKLQAPLAFQVVNRKGLYTRKEKGVYLIGADRFLTWLP